MKLSIITINYNNKDGLQKTIDSVICQTWKDYEWIIIDGGSTDGSKELIEKYQQHFAYWCSEPDKGVYNAMNKGIAKAKGEYLNFMNSGDCLHDKYVLSKIGISNFKSDIISGVSVSQETGRPMKRYHLDVVHQLFFDSLNHQATFIRRALFAKYKYNEENKIVSDWEFFVRSILVDGCSLEYLDAIVADFDTNGISNQLDMQSLQKAEREKVLAKYFSIYIRKDIYQYLTMHESYDYMQIKDIQKNHLFLYRLVVKIYQLTTLLNKLNKRFKRKKN